MSDLPECGASIRWKKVPILTKTPNEALRTAILSAFDQSPICTIIHVVNHIQAIDEKYELFSLESYARTNTSSISYRSTRRTMQSMVREGLLTEIPQRGNKNQIFFTKAMFKNATRFVDLDGNTISLREFIYKLTDNAYDLPLIEPNAMNVIKAWMLAVLGSSIPDAYTAKGKPVPPVAEYRQKLREVQIMTKKFHMLISEFLKADVWTPVAKETLAREFNSNCVEEHSIIVDGSWMKDVT